MFESWKCGVCICLLNQVFCLTSFMLSFFPRSSLFPAPLIYCLVLFLHILSHSQLLCWQFQCGVPTSVQYGFSIAIAVNVICCSISAVILLLLLVTSHKWLNCFTSSICIPCMLISHPITWSPILRTCVKWWSSLTALYTFFKISSYVLNYRFLKDCYNL